MRGKITRNEPVTSRLFSCPKVTKIEGVRDVNHGFLCPVIKMLLRSSKSAILGHIPSYMTPKFADTNGALYFTLRYFKIGTISDHLKKLRGDLNLDYIESYYHVTINSHREMENEIRQHTLGSLDHLKNDLFDYIDGWLKNWQFNPGYENYIESMVDEYNANEIKRHSEEVAEDEIKYRNSVPPGIEYGEDYTVEIPAFYNHFLGRSIPAKTEKRTFLFISTKKADLLDKVHLPKYLNLVETLIESFRDHSEKFIQRLFNVTFYPQSALKQPEQIQLSSPELPSNEAQTRLKFNLTNRQIIYLFNALREHKILDKASNADIARFINAYISTSNTTEPNFKDLQNNFGELDKATANYWVTHFKNLHAAAVNF